MEIRKTYIDGYNVLRKISRYARLLKSNADAARRGFVEFVRSHPQARGSVTIVFDGFGEAISAGKQLTVVFANTRTADTRIRLELEQQNQRSSIRVISSDREVQDHARAFGAQILSSEDFLRESTSGASEKSGTGKQDQHELSQQEIQMWMNLFKTGRSNPE